MLIFQGKASGFKLPTQVTVRSVRGFICLNGLHPKYISLCTLCSQAPKE